MIEVKLTLAEETMIDAKEHYKKFLNIDGAKEVKNTLICVSDNRENWINNCFYCPLIGTIHQGQRVLSISKLYADEFVREFDAEKIPKMDNFIINFFENRQYNFIYKKLIRLSKNELPEIDTSAEILDEKRAQQLLSYPQSHINDMPYWKERVKNGNVIATIKESEIVSTVQLSDFYDGAANLVVNTHKNHRNKGYATQTVIKAAEACLQRDILPIYFLDAENIASFKTAKAAGFKELSIEYAVTYLKPKQINTI